MFIRNEGRESHVFTSTLLAVPQLRLGPAATVTWADSVSLVIQPGQTVELTFRAPPGLYPFRCRIRGHAGMEGLMIVEDAGHGAA